MTLRISLSAARQFDTIVIEMVGELRAPSEEELQRDVSLCPPVQIQEAAASVSHQDEHGDESVECRILTWGSLVGAMGGDSKLGWLEYF